jgi:hypothetical protein
MSGKRSPRAVITASGQAVTQSIAAPVPRPPQPMTPTLIFSPAPPAKRTPVPLTAATREAREVVLMKSRRVTPLWLSVMVMLLFYLAD